ncbi:hypothetical protein PCI56_19120 [Plesiomonas shigelloides subsp. oncorhynchi]|nr:hypothetical protein [Plesiomonas shigelloides]
MATHQPIRISIVGADANARNHFKKCGKITGPGGELGLINFKEQFILFSPLNITHFSYLAPVEQQERNGWQWMQEGEHRYLIVRQNQPLSCINTAQGQMLGKAHGDEWVLISKQDLTPDCEKPTHRELFFTQNLLHG